mgnify:CR=1 FL=1
MGKRGSRGGSATPGAKKSKTGPSPGSTPRTPKQASPKTPASKVKVTGGNSMRKSLQKTSRKVKERSTLRPAAKTAYTNDWKVVSPADSATVRELLLSFFPLPPRPSKTAFSAKLAASSALGSAVEPLKARASRLCFGINAVARQLTQDNLCVVFVCQNVRPGSVFQVSIVSC